MKKITLLISMLILCSNLMAQSWHLINPTTGYHHLNDISFISPGSGIAVADNGVIFHYNDNIWTQADNPVSVNLNAVEYISPSLAWAVGNNGTILKYDGSEWIQQNSPTTQTLKDICIVDESNGWAVGNTILFYNGNSWQVQATASGLTTVSFATPGEGWAAGSFGTIKHFINGEWIIDSDLGYNFYSGVSMTSANSVILNGHSIDGTGLLYKNTGSGWQPINSGGVNSGISFLNVQNGFGIQNFIAFNTDIYPSVYKYSDGSWTKEFSTKYSRVLTSIEAIGEDEAYTIDTTGFIYHGLSGNWGVSNGFTTDSIMDISFTQANNGYFACGIDGIWNYNEGIWNNMLRVPGYLFNKVAFTDENYGWAAAFNEYELPPPFNYQTKLFRYTDGEWTEILISGFIDIWSPVTSIEITSTEIEISFYNSIYTLNGENWELFDLPFSDSITKLAYMEPYPIVSPDMRNSQNWEAAWMSVKRNNEGVSGVIYFKDFVNNIWQEVYETSNGSFNDLCIFGYNQVVAVGTNGLIAIFDGSSWSEVTPITFEALLSVHLDEFMTGWAVGRSGTILQCIGGTWSVYENDVIYDLNIVSFYDNTLGIIGGNEGAMLCTSEKLPVANSYFPVSETKYSLKVYPNPAGESFSVEFESLSANGKLTISDLTGRVVLEKTTASPVTGIQIMTISAANLSKGVYVLTLVNGNEVRTGKLVVR
ncbi:MAG: T9SS type A sorting domain-containing protein [Lentimicrobium sp.]|nr:T9SS type A sorting domain-containing protein [Lentimicrobium sp.]